MVQAANLRLGDIYLVPVTVLALQLLLSLFQHFMARFQLGLSLLKLLQLRALGIQLLAVFRVELPEERLQADFNDDSVLELTPDLIGPSKTLIQGIVGEGVDLNLKHTDDLRSSTILF